MQHIPALPRARPVSRGLTAILIALAVAAIVVPLGIVLNAPRIAPAAPRAAVAAPPRRVIPKAELPPVEPTAFVAVTPDDARGYNASIPFSTAPLLTARPFRITGAPDSIARANDCLAAGVLYEAGDDTDDQRAVAQVILNRVRHPAFPKSVCGVVFQGQERRTGCQFTFTCDGALARRYSQAAWERASEVARAALAGSVDRRVGMATHYHTDWVVPYWSASLDKVSEVHTHLFFRWTGWWGTPPAFRGRYLADEPLVARLRGIAPAHGGAVEVAPVDAIAADALPVEALPGPSMVDANTFVITLDARLSPGEYAPFARRLCGGRPYCKLLAWTERADTPASLPADAAVMGRMAFSYLRDYERGFEKALWNCGRFERPDPNQCMKSQTFGTPRRKAPPAARRETLGLTNAEPDTPTELTGVRRSGTLSPVPVATPTPAPN